MALTQRQKAAYKHLCDIWSVGRTITSGVPGDETFTLAYSGVACLYQYTPNVDDVTDSVGRVKTRTIFTTDIVHFDAAQEVKDAWILVNRSLLADGSHSPAYGEVHRVLGAPRIIANAGNRKANKRSVMAMSMEHAPTGVS